jgi:hypothetical protein
VCEKPWFPLQIYPEINLHRLWKQSTSHTICAEFQSRYVMPSRFDLPVQDPEWLEPCHVINQNWKGIVHTSGNRWHTSKWSSHEYFQHLPAISNIYQNQELTEPTKPATRSSQSTMAWPLFYPSSSSSLSCSSRWAKCWAASRNWAIRSYRSRGCCLWNGMCNIPWCV